MFTNFTWGAYVTTVSVTLVLYYVFIGAKFYFTDIRNFLNGRHSSPFRNPWNESQQEVASPSPSSNPSDNSTAGIMEENTFNDFEVIEELVERVKSLITNAVEHQASKDVFFSRLQAVLKDYPSLQKSQFRPSVNEFIVSESELQGMSAITQEEVEALWGIK